MQGITGSWLCSGDPESQPIAAGALVLDAAGRIEALGELSALRSRYPGLHFESHAAVLLPGLVNAHTHLELSGLRGRVPGGHGFVPWVDAQLRERAHYKPEEDSESIDAAISELLAAGVVAIGEVCNRLKSVELLADVPIVACIFHEVFGVRKDTSEAMLGMADQERAGVQAWPAHLRYALAPHTPYTLHPEVLAQIVRRSGRTSLHLAEHAAERAFLEHGGGPFAEFLRARGASPLDWSPPGCDAITHLDRLGVLGPELIAVHLTDARPSEIALLRERGCAVVLCPRSNLYIEVRLPPLLEILQAGLRPGLGTDSLASNTSLDPLAEARALRQRFPTVPALTLLAMATSFGADALGLSSVLGRLQVGAYPGVLAIEHGPSVPSDPARFVLDQAKAVRRMLSRPAYQRLPDLFDLSKEVSA